MNILKDKPQFFANYFNFLLDFARKPTSTISAVTIAPENTEQKVNSSLVGYLLLSVGVAFVINSVGVAGEMAPDSSSFVRFISRVDERLLPVAVLIAILLFATVSHLIVSAVATIQTAIGGDQFKGSIAGAVNAFTGFAAWSIPLFVAMLVAIRIVDAQTTLNPLFFLIPVLPMSVILPAYLIAALAGGYRITIYRAAYLFGASVVLIYLVMQPLH